jgi:hypothetical protein
MRKDRPRHDRGRREPVVTGDAHLHAVRGEHFERHSLGGSRQRVRVLSHEERPIDRLLAAPFGDCLCDRLNVPLVEARLERGAAMTTRAECDALCGARGIRYALVKRSHQGRDVDDRFRRHRLAGEGMERHAANHTALIRANFSEGHVISAVGMLWQMRTREASS